MDNRFKIKKINGESITMTIRIDKGIQDEFDQLAVKTNRSRNELISMALRYALDNMEIED